MAYEYRPDKGLKFLKNVSSKDLHDLVEFLRQDSNNDFSDYDKFKKHYPNHNKYWKIIATEIQTFGGNTFSNLYRGHGTTYREVLYDVCDRLKVNYNKGSSIKGIELNLLQKVLADTFEELSRKEKIKFLKSLGAKKASTLATKGSMALAQILLKSGGFATYKWALILVNGTIGAALKAATGTGLSLVTNATLTRVVGVALGPIGWALTAAWTAYSFADTAYRVTVPAVLYIAMLRLKQSQKVLL